jgi:hypothetical protein
MPKFKPIKQFTLFGKDKNGKSHFGNQTKTSRFISDIIRLHIDMGGLDVNIYRMLGTFGQDADALGVMNDPHGTDTADDENVIDTSDTREFSHGPVGTEPLNVGSFLGIQDTVLNENRDRAYDFEEIPILRGVYTVSQNELEFLRFGLGGLANDIITMEFHVQEMEKQLERRLTIGDVIEMPHLREVGIDGRIANKWYEVSGVAWSPTGYDPMYGRHVMGVTLRPLRDQQEFLDLFERHDEYGRTLRDQMSNREAMMRLTERNQELAREHANTTGVDTTIMWFCEDDPEKSPHLFSDDALPPNGIPVMQGGDFPSDPAQGDWFVRTDFERNRLYQFENGKWRTKEIDRKREWQPYNHVQALRGFMSDRSEEDRKRPGKLRNIHDVLTDREDRSQPSPDDPVSIKESDEVLNTNDGKLKDTY